MKVMKKIFLVLGILVLVCILTFIGACMQVTYEWGVHSASMITLANRTIPGYSKSVHDDLHIEETDDYGRYLFSVDHGDPSAKHAFIIVQKEDRENEIVYYYSEDSTLLVNDLWNLSEEEKEQLELLKQKNDWNQPLQEDKMTALSTKYRGRT